MGAQQGRFARTPAVLSALSPATPSCPASAGLGTAGLSAAGRGVEPRELAVVRDAAQQRIRLCAPNTHRRALAPRFGTHTFRLIVDFAEPHAALMVCRTLSCADKEAVQGRLRFMALNHVVLRVPGEFLNSDEQRCFVRTHRGEEIDFVHYDKRRAVADKAQGYLYQNLPRGSIGQRAQLVPSFQFLQLCADEIRKATEVLDTLYTKLNFYKEILNVDITELTIRDPKDLLNCQVLGVHLAEHLANLQHLHRVNVNKSVSPGFVEQMNLAGRVVVRELDSC